jgi:hypothetical protein
MLRIHPESLKKLMVYERQFSTSPSNKKTAKAFDSACSGFML